MSAPSPPPSYRTAGQFTPVQPPPQQRSVAKWVILGCGSALVFSVLFVVGLFLFVFHVMKDTPPYQDALRAARGDSRVLEALGAPVEEGYFISGKVETSSRGGRANLDIPIHGPKGAATLHVRGTRSNGQWTYMEMTVNPDRGGTAIDLLPHDQQQ